MAVTAFTAASILIGDLDASPFVQQRHVDVHRRTARRHDVRQRRVPVASRRGCGPARWAPKASKTGRSAASTRRSTRPTADSPPSCPSHPSRRVPTLAAGDPVAFMRGPIDNLTEGDGAADELAKMAIHLSPDTPFYHGFVLAPLATRTTTAAGTEVTLTGPTATQQLYAGLHVTSGSGGTLTVSVQTDTAGFPRRRRGSRSRRPPARSYAASCSR